MTTLAIRKAATFAMADPRVQELAYQVANELGSRAIGALKKKKKKSSNNNNNNNQNVQLMRYIEPSYSRAPVSLNTRARVRKARITGMGGGITIRHKEFITDVIGNTTFGVVGYNIQPGLPSTFPWLADIANNFEKYKIVNLKIEYINVSATSERGRITLAYDKDPMDSEPTTKSDLFSYSGTTEGAVWSPLSLDAQVNKSELFTRSGAIANSDLKTYDAGKIYVAVSNSADNSTVVGELFVSYDIHLSSPQPADCPSAVINASVAANTSIFGTVNTITGNFPATVSTNRITFDAPGYYALCITINGTSPGNIVDASSTVTYVVKVATTNGNTNAKSTYLSYVKCTSPGQYYQANASGGTVSSSYTTLTKISSDVYSA